MADPLYLSLWLPDSEIHETLARTLSVMRHFPFSKERPGITYLAFHPVSWNEATVLEQRFRPGATPEEAVLLASESLHEDYAYVFESYWDLWTRSEKEDESILQPTRVRFLAHGVEFEDGLFEQEGNIEIDLGLDAPFLQEDVALTEEAQSRARANVQKLVEFTTSAEKASGAASRLLWSESNENLAQKLIARLQKVQ